MEILYSRGVIQVGLVMDRDLLFDAKLGSIFQEYYPETGRLKIVDGSCERGFQAMFELCAACSRMDAVIAGSPEIGAGIGKALEMLKMGHVPVYVIKESSWIEDTGTYAGEISLSPKQTAREAVGRLIEAMDAHGFDGNPARRGGTPVCGIRLLLGPGHGDAGYDL